MSPPQPSRGPGALADLATLDDPARRRLYDYVCGRDEPVGRDDAARAASISRSLAAYHLDKLADHGLLSVSYRRLGGRTGPGAGRPAKLYSRPQRELSFSVPPRDYELAAQLLARAADGSRRDALAAARSHGRDTTRAAGKDRRARDRGLQAHLRDLGYEPVADGDGTLALRNCPFHAVAASHPELVCALNLALIEGILEGLGCSPQRARLQPRAGRCCVTISPPG